MQISEIQEFFKVSALALPNSATIATNWMFSVQPRLRRYSISPRPDSNLHFTFDGNSTNTTWKYFTKWIKNRFWIYFTYWVIFEEYFPWLCMSVIMSLRAIPFSIIIFEISLTQSFNSSSINHFSICSISFSLGLPVTYFENYQNYYKIIFTKILSL